MANLIHRLRNEAIELRAWSYASDEQAADKIHNAVLDHSIPYSKICLFVLKQGIGEQLQIIFGCLLPDHEINSLPVNFVFETPISPLNDWAIQLGASSFECSHLQEVVQKCLQDVSKINPFYAAWNFNDYKIIPVDRLEECMTANQQKWFSLIKQCKCCTWATERVMDVVGLPCEHVVHRRCLRRLTNCPECAQNIAQNVEALWVERFLHETSQMQDGFKLTR